MRLLLAAIALTVVFLCCGATPVAVASPPPVPAFITFSLPLHYSVAQVRAIEAQLARDPAVGRVRFVSCSQQIYDLIQAGILSTSVSCDDPPRPPGARGVLGQPYICVTAKPSMYARRPAFRLYPRSSRQKPVGVIDVGISWPPGTHRYGICEYY